MDTLDKGKATVDDVSIVQDYLNVFPKDSPRVPPERQVVKHPKNTIQKFRFQIINKTINIIII